MNIKSKWTLFIRALLIGSVAGILYYLTTLTWVIK